MKKQKTQENSRIENFVVVVKGNQSSSNKDCISQTWFRKAAKHYLEHMASDEESSMKIFIDPTGDNEFSMTEEFAEIVLKAFNGYVEDIFKILEEMTKWGINGTGEKKTKTLHATTINQSIEHLDALRDCVYE